MKKRDHVWRFLGAEVGRSTYAIEMAQVGCQVSSLISYCVKDSVWIETNDITTEAVFNQLNEIARKGL